VTDAAGLTAELREQVLVHLGDRLSQGEVLVSGKQFVNAAEEGFLTLTGEPVAAANAADPTQLLVPGFENWVTLSVLAQVRKAGWGITEVQEQGTQLIRDFMKSEGQKNASQRLARLASAAAERLAANEKEQSTADPSPKGLGPVVLMGDPESLRPLIDLMDRKETEARMIARRRPC
jgi:hypothetical protein